MTSFPVLSTGAVAQYPSSRAVQASVHVLRFVDGSEQRFRSTKGAARRWVIRLSQVSDVELTAIEAFFAERQGRAGSFEFTDPWDGTVYSDCSFEHDEIETLIVGEDRGAVELAIRENQV